MYCSVELTAWALKKATGYGRDRWRFFLLEGHSLLYFQSPPREGQRGAIDLSEVERVYMFRKTPGSAGASGDRAYLIEVRARHRVVVLYLPDWASLRPWQVLFTALGANRPVPPEEASRYKDYTPLWALDNAITAPKVWFHPHLLGAAERPGPAARHKRSVSRRPFLPARLLARQRPYLSSARQRVRSVPALRAPGPPQRCRVSRARFLTRDPSRLHTASSTCPLGTSGGTL